MDSFGILIDITKPRYELRGECSRCGECCINENCDYLEMKNEIAICLIYKDRFERCRLFPANPPIMFKNCSYYFWDKWEKKAVKTGKDL